MFVGLKEGLDFRSVSYPDCSKRPTPPFEGGLQGFLTLDLGSRDIWNRGLDRCLWESECGERGASDVCWDMGFSATLDRVEGAESVR